MPDEEKNGKVVEFPQDEARMAAQLLPDTIGRVEPGHPLKRPMTIAIIVLGLILIGTVITTIAKGPPQDSNDAQGSAVTDTYREPGAITYEEVIIDGWFLDEGRQNFMGADGRRFSYVDSHLREGSPVSGHWRLKE